MLKEKINKLESPVFRFLLKMWILIRSFLPRFLTATTREGFGEIFSATGDT